MIDRSPESDLEQQLTLLHKTLEEQEAVSPENRELLTSVVRDISRVLGAEERTEQDWNDLGERWHEMARRFEANHPQLAQVIEQITTTLANAGI